MYENVVKEYACMFEYVPDRFKTREMYENVIREHSDMFEDVPDWFVTDGILDECQDKDWLQSYEQHKA